MWIKREISDYVLKIAGERPALVITGARQSGKTSLLKHLFQQHRFTSLDLSSEAAQADNDPTSFLKRNPPPLILDEIQYAPGIFRQIKFLIDQNRESYSQFLMTGSQNFALMKGISESLAGRVSIIELENFSFYEINQAFPNFRLEDCLLKGGFPELYANPKIDYRDFLRSYVVTYLERDLRNILNVSDLRDFERFLRCCALRSGQLLNKADLAKDVGISPTTASKWISVLESSGQFTLLEPWYSNKSKSLIKSPKIYMNDVGTLLFLMGISNEDELLRSPYLGAIWETFVFAEIRKRQLARQGHWKLYFIRDRSKEVDFLVHKGGRFDLIEAKWNSQISERDCDQLDYFSDFLGPKNINSKIVISRSPHSYRLKNDCQVRNILEIDTF